MRVLLIGGPQHGKTLTVWDDAREIVFPNYGSLRASYARMFDPPGMETPFGEPTTIRYRRESFGLALTFGSRFKVAVFVCASDVSMKTAESYMIDVLASGFQRELDAREVAR